MIININFCPTERRAQIYLMIFIFIFCLFHILLLFYMTSFITSAEVHSEQNHELKDETTIISMVLPFELKTETITSRNCTFTNCFNVNCCLQKFANVPLRDDEGKEQCLRTDYQFYDEIKRAFRTHFPSPDFPGNCSCLNLCKNDLTDLSRWKPELFEFSSNTILFNIFPPKQDGYLKIRNEKEQNIFGSAMVASTAFVQYSIRPEFDVAIPFVNTAENLNVVGTQIRKTFILATGLKTEQLNDFWQSASTRNQDDISSNVFCSSKKSEDRSDHVQNRCTWNKLESGVELVSLKTAMSQSQFCILPHDSWYQQTDLSLALSTGCIPVITSSMFVLPFASLIDWKETAVILNGQTDWEQIFSALTEIQPMRIKKLQLKGREVFNEYFSSIDAVVMNTLHIIRKRIEIFKQNDMVNSESASLERRSISSVTAPLSVPSVSPIGMSRFTAVVLTHDDSRPECLLQLVKTVMEVSELSRVLIVWNNEVKYASPAANVVNKWPPLPKPLKVVNMMSNKLTNRFLPLKDIDTDAVLSLDDDMTGLKSHDIKNAFDIWKLNSNRLVGFVGWSKKWNEEKIQWELTENTQSQKSSSGLSFVSTGAMFYHKKFAIEFSYYFDHFSQTRFSNFEDEATSELSSFSFIEESRNCEDIAFNLFVANMTKLQPMKVNCDVKDFEGTCSSSYSYSEENEGKEIRSERKANCVNYFYPIFKSIIDQSVNVQFKWTVL